MMRRGGARSLTGARIVAAGTLTLLFAALAPFGTATAQEAEPADFGGAWDTSYGTNLGNNVSACVKTHNST